MMHYERLSIPDVVLMTPKVFGDERGFFMESFNQRVFEEITNIQIQFVQDNHSRSRQGVLRGLHYQLTQPQGKLVRVTRGEVFDVALDIRRASPSFGQWVGAFLSEDNGKMLWVPPGFAHGFLVTSEEADLQYKCTDYYAPDDEHCIRWDDPSVAIDWPAFGQRPVLSSKDEQGLSLNAAPHY